MIKTLFTFFFFSLYFNISALHIKGGEMYYNYLGENNYEVNILFYKNDTNLVEFDNNFELFVFNNDNDLQVGTYSVELVESQIQNVAVLNNYSISCPVEPSDTNVEFYIYSTIVNLPPINAGYTICFQRCCLDEGIVNIVEPDDNGFTWSCQIPGTNTGFTINSSPRFINHSPFLLCRNEELTFFHGAYDSDGDSLVYSLYTPFSGGSLFFPLPNVDNTAFSELIWNTNYDYNLPLGLTSETYIDQNNGNLTLTPSENGQFVIGIKVKEYRDGIFLGEVNRNFITTVIDQTNEMESLEKSYAVFPNPSSGFINIKSDAGDLLNINVISTDGRLIYKSTKSDSVNLSSFPEGSYILQLQYNDSFFYEKIQIKR